MFCQNVVAGLAESSLVDVRVACPEDDDQGDHACDYVEHSFPPLFIHYALRLSQVSGLPMTLCIRPKRLLARCMYTERGAGRCRYEQV